MTAGFLKMHVTAWANKPEESENMKNEVFKEVGCIGVSISIDIIKLSNGTG